MNITYKIPFIIVLSAFVATSVVNEVCSEPCEWASQACVREKYHGVSAPDYCKTFSNTFTTNSKKKIEKYKLLNEELVKSCKETAETCLKVPSPGIGLRCAREACEHTESQCLQIKPEL